VRKLGFWRRLAVSTVKPPLFIWTKRDWSGFEHIPQTGGVIIVLNHMSHADPVVAAHYLYDSGRWPQFLAKASVFRLPLIGWLLRKVRQIPVQRGTVDAVRALDTAVDAVKNGGAVVIYPEGTTTKEPDLWPMRGKTGAARLALETGAPVIPVVMWGPEKMFDPRTHKLFWRIRVPVTVQAGPAIDLSKWEGAAPTTATLYAITDEIMLVLRDMLAKIRGGTPPPLWTPAAARRANGATDNDAADDGVDDASVDDASVDDGSAGGGENVSKGDPEVAQ
jgi:1-acyl-sn-glycerol-3-phosphate acyltransferase